MHEVSVLSDFLDLFITFIFLLSIFHQPQAVPCATSPRRWGLLTNASPHTGYEPKVYFFTETYVEFNHESMTEQRIP